MKLNKTMKENFVQKVLDNLDKTDYRSQVQEILNKEALSKLPKELQAKEVQHYLEGKRIYIHQYSCMGNFYVRNAEYEPSEKALEQIAILHGKYEQQRDGKKQADRELTALMQNIHSLKKAIEILPAELHKYLPKEPENVSAQFAVTTTSVMDNLKKLGLQA